LFVKILLFLFKTVIGTIFKHNSCESSDGCSKHMIYRAGNEVYGRISLSETNLKTCILHRLFGKM